MSVSSSARQSKGIRKILNTPKGQHLGLVLYPKEQDEYIRLRLLGVPSPPFPGIYSIQDSLNRDLSSTNQWLIANIVTLNLTKTEFMLIGSRQKLKNLPTSPTFEINGTQISRVNVTKSLGVLIDENLTWCNHIDSISKKISSGIGAIK